jgi:hypothetical protein
MNSVIVGLADRIASLVPSALPQREAAAKCYSKCMPPASCNAGDFFVDFRFEFCGSHSYFKGCCG